MSIETIHYFFICLKLLSIDWYSRSRYRKNPKIPTPEIFAVIILKFEQVGFTHRIMRPKDADGMSNSIGQDKIAP